LDVLNGLRQQQSFTANSEGCDGINGIVHCVHMAPEILITHVRFERTLIPSGNFIAHNLFMSAG
jgi:hypothetical protein